MLSSVELARVAWAVCTDTESGTRRAFLGFALLPVWLFAKILGVRLVCQVAMLAAIPPVLSARVSAACQRR